jgi:DNA repair exonuclease SbcCD ATPase subunit
MASPEETKLMEQLAAAQAENKTLSEKLTAAEGFQKEKEELQTKADQLEKDLAAKTATETALKDLETKQSEAATKLTEADEKVKTLTDEKAKAEGDLKAEAEAHGVTKKELATAYASSLKGYNDKLDVDTIIEENHGDPAEIQKLLKGAQIAAEGMPATQEQHGHKGPNPAAGSKKPKNGVSEADMILNG